MSFLSDAHGAPARLDAHLAECHECRALVACLAADRTTAAEPAAEPTLPVRTAALDDRRIGTEIGGKWRIEGLLGSGGMGRVYRARHRNGHAVAVKVLHPALAVDPDVVRRFRREGYAANRVGHPAVVKVLDDGDDSSPFLVMELLDGRSCRARMRTEGPLSASEALDVIERVGEALAAAHRVGIIHRDIKPDNLFVTPSGDVRLLDFGLASVRAGAAEEGATMTVDGVTMGTVGYMAPEQARGDNANVTARSDVWSLAATCVTLATGRLVHAGTTPAERLAFTITRPAPPVRDLGLDVSAEVAAVLDRALSFEAARRQADAEAFVAELARARAMKSDVPAVRRSRARIVAGPLVLSGVVVVASFAMLDRSAPTAPRVDALEAVTSAHEAGGEGDANAPARATAVTAAVAPTSAVVSASASRPARDASTRPARRVPPPTPSRAAPAQPSSALDAGAPRDPARPAEEDRARDPLQPRL